MIYEQYQALADLAARVWTAPLVPLAHLRDLADPDLFG